MHQNFMDSLNEVYLAHGNAKASRAVELGAVYKDRPYYDEFWEEHTANVENIVCPLYVITSLADNVIHTPGSIGGYIAAKSASKWIELHP